MCSKNNAQIIQIWIILGDILTTEPGFFMNQCVCLTDTCFMLLWTLPICDFVLLSVLQVDQLSCNGDRKVQPDRSQAIRERLRGKGLPTGKCFIAGRVKAIEPFGRPSFGRFCSQRSWIGEHLLTFTELWWLSVYLSLGGGEVRITVSRK